MNGAGRCNCGCGAVTTPGRMFRLGHWAKTELGAARLSEIKLVGDPIDHGDGYLTINVGIGKGHKLYHRVIAEKMLGRPLLETEKVHHKDENKNNNDPSNLVVCKNDAEHQLLHLQARALKECGHSDWRKCSYCKQWDDTKNLTIRTTKNGGVTVEHRACGNAYRAQWLREKKLKAKRVSI